MAKSTTEVVLPSTVESIRECLSDLESLHGHLGMLGGREQSEVFEHERKLKSCLSPPNPETVLTEAKAFTTSWREMVEARRAWTVSQERAADELAAKHKAERERIHAERMAQAQAKRDRQMAAVNREGN